MREQNTMANRKEITRDDYIKFRVSKEEKELFYKYAEELGVNPSRLARNIILMQAESILNKPLYIPISKAYIKYCEVTNNKEVLERIKQP